MRKSTREAGQRVFKAVRVARKDTPRWVPDIKHLSGPEK